ncbi:HD domain-containing protein [Amycolatopsis samaneae]|uniref:Metal-dependent phosphohydrolase n=1 Tax=Amycolatopsis samaneae TaxID=664691 RepID=A0ABW5GAZ4_9PSEU
MRWDRALTLLGGDGRAAEDAWTDLERRYGEPHRRYHDLRHAEAVARHAAEFTADPRVTLAAWAHDVVYDATPGDDERASAAWAREWLTRAGLAEADIARVEELILTTIGHDAPDEDLLATALLDADLATLGAPPAVYDEYARGVREEYAKYPDEVWRPGRAAVLERMLAKPRLYRGEIARERWEAPARRNLTAELERWR